MRTEYKRDVSHNYLILQEEKAVDTSVHTEMSFAESGWRGAVLL